MKSSVLKSIQNKSLIVVLLSYTVLSLLFGGASFYWLAAHGALQAVAAFGIAILAVTWPRNLSLTHVRFPIGLICAMALIGLLQTLPISWGIWTSLPGRGVILEGFESLEIAPTSLPISLDYASTLFSAGYALPPLFVILLCVRIGAQALMRAIPTFFCVVAFFMVLLGLSQVYSGNSEVLYFYENTNFGFPVGTFSNVNHAGTFLLMVFPFTFLLLREVLFSRFSFDLRVGLAAAVSVVMLFIFIGIGAAGSLAIYFLFVPTVCLAYLGSRSPFRHNRASLLSGGVLFVIVVFGIILVSSSPLLEGLGVTGSSEGSTSRHNIWAFTIQAIGEYWPVGTGLGTYRSVIPQFENADNVTSTYIALAHNEYLQITLELGAPGVAVIFIGLVWLLHRSVTVWFSGDRSMTLTIQKMALIGVMVCVVHSFVDYPARTPAIACVVAICVAIVSISENEHSPTSERTPSLSKRLIL